MCSRGVCAWCVRAVSAANSASERVAVRWSLFGDGIVAAVTGGCLWCVVDRRGRYIAYLQQLRQTCVGRHMRSMTLPKHLIAQIDAFLPPLEDMHVLVDSLSSAPCLLHGDINDDNVLGHYGPSVRRWYKLARCPIAVARRLFDRW